MIDFYITRIKNKDFKAEVIIIILKKFQAMKINNFKIDKCRACGNPKEFMTFGKMPIANGFLQNKEDKEYFFEMSPAFCSQCFTFQLVEQPDAKLMFHEDYVFLETV